MIRSTDRLKRGLGFAGALFVAALTLPIGTAAAATTTYASRIGFLGAVGASLTDRYDNPAYVFSQTDAAMSAVLGQTSYQATGHLDTNLVFQGKYCAGCNGSFQLGFGSTSLTAAGGVFGVAVDYFDYVNASPDPYTAFVRFADGTSTDYALVFTPDNGGPDFFGVTSDRQIASIHFARGDVSAQDGLFVIDNLTIGGPGPAVPEPATWAMMILGLGGVGLALRTRRRKALTA